MYLGLLSASFFAMTEGPEPLGAPKEHTDDVEDSRLLVHRRRRYNAETACAVASVVIAVVPPVATLSRRYEYVEALQFSIFAVVVPALLSGGAPWRVRRPRHGVAYPRSSDNTVTDAPRIADRWAMSRRRHPGPVRSVAVFTIYVAVTAMWRTPIAVNGFVHHGWLVIIEGFTEIGVGTLLWLELVSSPPFVPRLSRPHRIGLAAVSMWSIWILAYVVGLSHGSWYDAYSHRVGRGLSLSADQQLTTGVLWFVSGCAFIPAVFWNLIRWLQSEEDPDLELHHLVRFERIRSGSGPLDR
jgi:cytochrome c oxidase assembly factor CtaG